MNVINISKAISWASQQVALNVLPIMYSLISQFIRLLIFQMRIYVLSGKKFH